MLSDTTVHEKHTLLHVIYFERYLRILLFLGFWYPLLVAYKTWTDPPYLPRANLQDSLLCKTLIFPQIEKCLNHTTLNGHRGLVPLSFSDCDPSEGVNVRVVVKLCQYFTRLV